MIALLRFIFVVCLLFLIRRLFQWVSGAGGGPRRRSQSAPPDFPSSHMKNLGKMVKDPVCGTYVDPSLAVCLVRGGESIYFCSPDCKSRYEGKRAAAG